MHFFRHARLRQEFLMFEGRSIVKSACGQSPFCLSFLSGLLCLMGGRVFVRTWRQLTDVHRILEACLCKRVIIDVA